MNTQEETFKQELWSTRFGFYYYNDHEIFKATNNELENQAIKYAQANINHVMTFSITHFRWSFQSGWQNVTNALERIVKAFHKFNIKVTEHHSANFIFSPKDSDGHKLMESRFSYRNSDISNWQSYLDDLNTSRDAGEGVTIESMLQIDGSTGKPIYNEFYAGHRMCPNNPDYVRLYLKYLEEYIYPTGVDGIMTDDISNYCACKHCRKLFKERTGLELPQVGSDWKEWENSKTAPTYRKWLKFGLDSCNDFHLTVKEHYEKLGLRMLRPNYISTAISFTYIPVQNFDNLPALDWAFQENNFSDIIRYTWPEWRVEAAHRKMIAGNRDIPSMSMFYPDRQDTVYFSWALATSWGNKYVGTTHNADIDQNCMEKPLREFEAMHEELLKAPQSIAKLAFYDSYENRIIYNNYNSRSAKLLSGCTQTCMHANIPWVMINKHDLTNLNDYSLLILPEVALLTKNELKIFQKFVRNGGQIIWLGNCAILDENGDRYDADTIASLIGISDFKNASANDESTIHSLGKGRIQTISLEESMITPETRITNHERWAKGGNEKRVPLDKTSFFPDYEMNKRKNTLNTMREMAPDIDCLKCEGAPVDLLVTAYKVDDKLAVHIVNATDTLTPPDSKTMGHSDMIPMPELKNDVKITITNYDAGNISKATLLRPQENDLELALKQTEEEIKIILPAHTVKCYGLIRLIA